jgi:hypothetical protein
MARRVLDTSFYQWGREFDELSRPFYFEPAAPAPRLIYLDNRAHLSAIVDADDYDYFSQWLWREKPDKHRHKWYAYRSTTVAGCDASIFLHKEILRRKEAQPDPRYKIADHVNGDSLDCRKANLRWATPSQNRITARCAALSRPTRR